MDVNPFVVPVSKGKEETIYASSTRRRFAGGARYACDVDRPDPDGSQYCPAHGALAGKPRMCQAPPEDGQESRPGSSAASGRRSWWMCSQGECIKVVVDSLAGAQTLNQAMREAHLHIDVLLDLNVGQNRCGVLPGEEALNLAHSLRGLSHLHLRGVQGYEGHLQHVHDPEERAQRCRQAMHLLTETAAQLRADGCAIDIVTTGGTGTAEICASCEGVTEVQPGSFVFMDTDYRNAIGPVYANALTILSTVISRPAPTRAVVDAGLKSLSTDSGMPEPKDLPGVTYRPGGDEHGILTWQEGALPASGSLNIGGRIELLPSHIDTTVNLHDVYYAHREGKLEAIWLVKARGKVQ